jgi:hypothetical protein
MAKRTKKQSPSKIVTGFINGTWDGAYNVLAAARNDNRPKAREMYSVLVEHYRFNIHPITRTGTPSVKPVLSVDIPRTRAAIERAANEYAAANPGKPFVMMYEGWFDGTECLPRYNNPVKKGDRVERIVCFTIPLYAHTGTQGKVKTSNAEIAAAAMADALSSMV